MRHSLQVSGGALTDARTDTHTNGRPTKVAAAPRYPVIWAKRIVVTCTPKDHGNDLDCLAAEITFRIRVAAGIKQMYTLSAIQDALLDRGFVAHYAEEPDILRLWVDDPEQGFLEVVLYLED